MTNSVKILGYSSATARDLLKALAILSETTVRRYAVDREYLRPYWKSEKKSTFLKVINNHIICKFFKDFIDHRKRLTGQ